MTDQYLILIKVCYIIFPGKWIFQFIIFCTFLTSKQQLPPLLIASPSLAVTLHLVSVSHVWICTTAGIWMIDLALMDIWSLTDSVCDWDYQAISLQDVNNCLRKWYQSVSSTETCLLFSCALAIHPLTKVSGLPFNLYQFLFCHYCLNGPPT